MPRTVTPGYIQSQREHGWLDIHPEDFCHRCGTRNMLWYATRDDWDAATSAWATETGREGICCPQCFAELHKEQTGESTIWGLTRYVPEPIRNSSTERES